MAEFDNTNRGVLFKNKKKTEKGPDYTGKLDVDGTDFELAAWIRKSQKGTMFMSLSLGKQLEKEEPKAKPQLTNASMDDDDNEIPF